MVEGREAVEVVLGRGREGIESGPSGDEAEPSASLGRIDERTPTPRGEGVCRTRRAPQDPHSQNFFRQNQLATFYRAFCGSLGRQVEQ